MRRCIRPRAGVFWPLALPMIPYMRANLAAKRTGLARADAIDCRQHDGSRGISSRARPKSRGRALEVIPNPVNISAMRELANHGRRAPNGGAPYALYLGKLAPEQGHRPA